MVGAIVVLTMQRNSSTRKLEVQLKESMKLQAEWFINNQNPEGDFAYELLTKDGERTKNYNVVRQAGSSYALAQYYKDTQDPIVEEALRKNYEFFYNKSLIMNESTNSRAIGENVKQVKSNTNALLVLSLVEFMEGDKKFEAEYLPVAIEYADYLLETQTEEGGFIYTYGYSEPMESAYNDGETLYALARIYKYTKDERYLHSAIKAADLYIGRYKNEPINLSFYSWAMAGYAHLYEVTKKDEYWDFMKSYTDQFFMGHGKTAQDYFDGNSLTIPHANLSVFLEGLAHVAEVAKQKDRQYYNKISSFYHESLSFLLTLQIEGPGSNRKSSYSSLHGGVCYNYVCEKVRIDMVHHALSAMHLYFKYLSN